VLRLWPCVSSRCSRQASSTGRPQCPLPLGSTPHERAASSAVAEPIGLAGPGPAALALVRASISPSPQSPDRRPSPLARAARASLPARRGFTAAPAATSSPATSASSVSKTSLRPVATSLAAPCKRRPYPRTRPSGQHRFVNFYAWRACGRRIGFVLKNDEGHRYPCKDSQPEPLLFPLGSLSSPSSCWFRAGGNLGWLNYAYTRPIAVRELDPGCFKRTLERIHRGLFCVRSIFNAGDSVGTHAGFGSEFPHAPTNSCPSHAKLSCFHRDADLKYIDIVPIYWYDVRNCRVNGEPTTRHRP
jgi:hypothetical protein